MIWWGCSTGPILRTSFCRFFLLVLRRFVALIAVLRPCLLSLCSFGCHLMRKTFVFEFLYLSLARFLVDNKELEPMVFRLENELRQEYLGYGWLDSKTELIATQLGHFLIDSQKKLRKIFVDSRKLSAFHLGAVSAQGCHYPSRWIIIHTKVDPTNRLLAHFASSLRGLRANIAFHLAWLTSEMNEGFIKAIKKKPRRSIARL
jgi:hypothetical protein